VTPPLDPKDRGAVSLTARADLDYVGRAVLNRRYFLVILDPTGRSVRRVGVSRRALEIGAALGLATLVAAGAFTLHGTTSAHVATESSELRRENEELRKVTAQLQERLPQARRLGRRAEQTFAQIWSKTGLGSAPNVLGIGPLDGDGPVPGPSSAEDLLALRPEQSHVLAVAPSALPLEFERLEDEAVALQTSLGEMLEYFHDAQQLLSSTPSIKPVMHGYLTSSFGKRSDPYNHDFVMHKGLDIGGSIGTPIVAPASGVVIFTGIRGGYGLTLVIDHGYGIQTHYGHLSAIHVKEGMHVQRGDLVAAVGSTGRSTGPHLHYEVRRAGQPLNPLRFILD
jgi:murein DD-endopeptidase MepM/ murein hydrolase activator NlpD